MTTPSRIIASLAPLAMVLACGTEADRVITGSLSASHTSNFSAWSEPISLGPTINTSGFNDQQPTLSKDALSLYFASARPEGPGDGGAGGGEGDGAAGDRARGVGAPTGPCARMRIARSLAAIRSAAPISRRTCS